MLKWINNKYAKFDRNIPCGLRFMSIYTNWPLSAWLMLGKTLSVKRDCYACQCLDNVDIWASAWDFQQCSMCDQQSLRSACAYAQSDQSLCYLLEYSMIVKLLTEHHLEFLSLKGGCPGSSESTLVKMPNCWKSHALAHIYVCKIWSNYTIWL